MEKAEVRRPKAERNPKPEGRDPNRGSPALPSSGLLGSCTKVLAGIRSTASLEPPDRKAEGRKKPEARRPRSESGFSCSAIVRFAWKLHEGSGRDTFHRVPRTARSEGRRPKETRSPKAEIRIGFLLLCHRPVCLEAARRFWQGYVPPRPSNG